MDRTAGTDDRGKNDRHYDEGEDSTAADEERERGDARISTRKSNRQTQEAMTGELGTDPKIVVESHRPCRNSTEKREVGRGCPSVRRTKFEILKMFKMRRGK